jgi:hypothetical protein
MVGRAIEYFVVDILDIGTSLIPCAWMLGVLHERDAGSSY